MYARAPEWRAVSDRARSLARDAQRVAPLPLWGLKQNWFAKVPEDTLYENHFVNY